MSQHEARQRILVRVCIAEPLLQFGVRAALAAEQDIEVLEEDPICVDQYIDVVVADSATAARFAQVGQRIEFPENLQLARILVISSQAREHAIRSALEQGVHGFLLTSAPVCDLLAGVRTLFRGRNYLWPPVARLLAQTPQRDMLTSRENEVLRLLTLGLCNKSIARDLKIAVDTVKTHVKSIMSKLDASCRTEAARIATERGLINLQDTPSVRARPLPYPTPWNAPSPLPRCA